MASCASLKRKKVDTENKLDLLEEAEKLLLLGISCDFTLCPLKLATFCLDQDKAEEAYIIASKVIDNADVVRMRHMFIDSIFKVIQEQYEMIAQELTKYKGMNKV